jgi:hypothetical protein
MGCIKMPANFVVPTGSPSDDVELIEAINESLDRLRIQRVASIEVTGPYLESKLAWKIATQNETILYRIVALGESLALLWNARYMLGCSLLARALMETSALLLDFERVLQAEISSQDLRAIDDLVTKRHFATRDKEWLTIHPETEATNILTLIDKLDKRHLPNARKVYDALSESCHPNYLGGHAMFGALDTETGTTVYSDTKIMESNRHAILGCAALMMLDETCFDRLKEHIERVAELRRVARSAD